MTFQDFYNLYPRKVAQEAARRAWDKAVKHTTPTEILDGLRRLLPALKEKFASDPQYVCYPATWLNQGRWKDEPVPRPGAKPRSTLNEAWAGKQPGEVRL